MRARAGLLPRPRRRASIASTLAGRPRERRLRGRHVCDSRLTPDAAQEHERRHRAAREHRRADNVGPARTDRVGERTGCDHRDPEQRVVGADDDGERSAAEAVERVRWMMSTVIGNASPFPNPASTIASDATQMRGATAAQRTPSAARQERERVDGRQRRAPRRSSRSTTLPITSPTPVRSPQEAVPERAAVERALRQEDLGDVDEPAREHREAEREENGPSSAGERRNVVSPSTRSRQWPRRDRLLALEQARRDAHEQQRREHEGRGVDPVDEVRPRDADDQPAEHGPAVVAAQSVACSSDVPCASSSSATRFGTPASTAGRKNEFAIPATPASDDDRRARCRRTAARRRRRCGRVGG